LLLEKDPRPPFRCLSQWGALTILIPNLKWEKTHETFFGHLLRTRVKGDPLLLRLLILLHALPFPKAVGSLGHLMFPRSMIDQVEQALLLLVRLRQGTLTLESAKKAQAKKWSPEVTVFLNQAMRIRMLFPKKEAIEDWRHFQDSRPCLSGQDMRNMGYKPGPLFKQMFEALRQARWEGKLRTREEEVRFLNASFPLNGS
jgi:tRNA nucleotidyltransferase/poly(A) polymerase